MYVLENSSDNPMEGNWIEKGEVKTGMSTFALDATIFFRKDELYNVWAQQDLEIKGHSNLDIAKMENTSTLKTEPVMLTKPHFSWNSKRHAVNEGRVVLIQKQIEFINFS